MADCILDEVRQPIRILVAVLTMGVGLGAAQTGPLALVAHFAEAFQNEVPEVFAQEFLHQISLRYPPHPFLLIGDAAAAPLTPRFLTTDIVSQYTIGTLKGAPATNLVELREIVSVDGKSVQTPAVARRALAEDARTQNATVRKHLLAALSRFALDVATDYGPILLVFTRAGQRDLRISAAGEDLVGAEKALRFQWLQVDGGALEFRGRKTARRAMQGSLWIRQSDGMPLRISAEFEHPEPKHVLRDTATVEYVACAAGFPVPATVVHRHYIDGRAITENLYTYGSFHLFTAETTIHYTGTPDPPVKK